MADYSKKPIPEDPVKTGYVYVAGPMSNVGPPTWNYPAFADMAKRLRKSGRKVISPHELHEADGDIAWDWYLRRDLTQLVKCSTVVMLPGWRSSRGASLEHQVALALSMHIVYPGEHEEFVSAGV